VNLGSLVNGVPHTFTVQAINNHGAGTASAHSDPVVPRSSPSAPGMGTPTAGAGSAVVRWTVPASDGGAPVNGYLVRAYRGTTLVRTATAAASATSVTVSGLANGLPHTFIVTASNSLGQSPGSARSVAVTPRSRPSPPRIGVPSPANGAAVVRWLPPLNNGGATVTAYVVRAYRGGTLVRQIVVSGRVTGAVVTGLPNGAGHTVTVTAVNAVGWGLPSATRSVVPRR
jgi:titin